MAPLGPLRLAIVLGMLAAVGLARAAELSARGPAECADSEELSFRVERSIGMTLEAAAALRFDVEMERLASGHRARIEVRTPSSPDVAMERVLTADDCEKLASAIGVAIALALGHDELSVGSAPSAGVPSQAVDSTGMERGDAAQRDERTASPALDDRPTPDPDSPSRSEGGQAPLASLSLSVLGDMGSLPSPAFGVALSARAQWRRFALRAVGTLLLEQEVRVEGALASGPGAKLELMTGALFGCMAPLGERRAALAPEACLGMELGRLDGEGTGIDFPRRGGVLWAAPVVQVGAVWTLPGTSLQLSSMLLGAAPLNRDRFALRGIGDVHQPPSLVGRWSLGFGVLFD